MSTVSITDMVGNSSLFWNVRATPRRITLCGGTLSSSWPSNITEPSSGWYSLVITLKAVVLPAPLGPMRPTTFPASTSIDTSSRAVMPPNLNPTFRSSRSAIAAQHNQKVRPRADL